jgi:molybdate/tungstate transport system ATP-binding protein
MLELRGVSKRLSDRFSLGPLDLRLEPGEYLCLMGPNGSGKSSLIELVVGLRPPDHGDVLWDGEVITNLPPERRNFAVAYQDYALFPHMTVSNNIGYGLRATRVPRGSIETRVQEAAEMLDIAPLLPQSPHSLSGGEKQRVALARALVVRPRLLLLDEPLSAMEVPSRPRLRRELKRIQRETKTTFLHVTHDAREARLLGDRLGVLLNGKLRQLGPIDEVFTNPADDEVATLLGRGQDPSRNISE